MVVSMVSLVACNLMNISLLYIWLQATSDTIETIIKSYRLYFSKQVLNLSGISDTPLFPEDYSGISGTDLLKRAPKT